jgi:hypothetical protein
MGKSKDEFKTAFKAIKKPKRPDAVSGSDKDQLEKAVDAATSYDGSDDLDRKNNEVLRLATEIQKNDEDYLVDLIAYKCVKHMDEGSEKKPVWAAAMPPDAYKAALLKIIPNDASDPITRKVLEKSLLSSSFENPTKVLIFDRDPDAYIEAVLDKWQEYDTDKTRDLQGAWAKAVPGDADTQHIALAGALTRGDKGLIAAISASATVLTVNDYKDVVEGNESLFITEILPGLKKKNEFHQIMADAEIRASLKGKAPDQWEALVDTTPMLKLLENVEKSFAPKKGQKNSKPPKSAEVVAKIFDSIVNNDGMKLGYRTVSEDPVRVILSGGAKEDTEARKKKKEILGDSFPDIPSTQCHSLLELTKTLMGAYPGVKPKIEQGDCKYMALTKKLSAIPGTGLLDKSFGGNVFDDNGASLDQVLFTGDEQGEKSHTWIIVDDVAYDPVLGTHGDEVKKAVAAELRWKIADRFAEVPGGLYIVKETNSPLKVKANQMGFTTAYRLTKNPSKFLTAEECKKEGLPPPPKADKGAKATTTTNETV